MTPPDYVTISLSGGASAEDPTSSPQMVYFGLEGRCDKTLQFGAPPPPSSGVSVKLEPPLKCPEMEKQIEGPRARLPGFESWPAVTDWEAGKKGVITADLRRAGTAELVHKAFSTGHRY